ncbi:MAG: hypothetical protein GY714_19125 [Desulfobacterales bacterium]|nr:hypothetical protein [Desulfobacterales bacterium]MCP4160427.1 hypothetical protein [Deltaproteobacteria bacterium]
MKSVKKIFGLFFIVFPFMIYGFEKYHAPAYCKYVLLFAAMLYMLFNQRKRFWMTGTLLFFSTIAVSFVEPDNLVRLYPFLMSTTVLAFFITCQRKEISALEFYSSRFVKITPEKQKYLHKASVLWIVGLSVNSFIFFILLFAFPLKIWLLYSGFLSYIFLVLMFITTVGGGLIYERR